MGLVEGYLCPDGFLLLSVELGDVQLIAQHSEGGYIEAGLDVGLAQRLVVGRGTDMAPHGGEGVAAAGSFLDEEAAVLIGVVAGPGLGHVAEHAEVEAVATASA